MAVCHASALQSHACSAHLTVADPGIRQRGGGGGGGGGGAAGCCHHHRSYTEGIGNGTF